MSKENNLIFIILRCVKDIAFSQYWKECYSCIRKHYDNRIFIIDDNSNPELIDDFEIKNTVVIKSEFPGAGEILPYYYFYKLKIFDTAVILHDSMFITKYINFNIDENIKFMWYFDSNKWRDDNREINLIRNLKNSNLIEEFYLSDEWKGCFGTAAVVKYDFVKMLEEKYNIMNLLSVVKTRKQRMGLERIIGALSFYEKMIDENCSFFGDIFDFCESFSYNWNNYKTDNIENKGLIKIWSGK